jgi:phosphatidylglycerophosphatase A
MAHGRSTADRLALLLGQWFGTGLAPKAPGTVGSLGALPLFWGMKDFPGAIYWSATVVLSLVGIAISERCAKVLDDKDPSSVVIDEVAGVLIALGLVASSPPHILAVAWVLFRVLDISKPWLIDKAQYLRPSGLGIMADDILAGLVAGAIAWALNAALPL